MSVIPALALLASLASGDSVVTLPGVEVRDARPLDDPALRRAPGFARAYDVAPAYGRLGTVSDLLARGVGVHVRQFGGLGSFSAVSIRGSSSAQVAYYLDGAPLNQAQYGVVNAADLPIEALSRVEVYRGSAPLAFDAPGGGVVELVTRDDPGSWARADLGGGSFGTHKMDAAGGLTTGHTTLMAVVQGLSSDGDFEYLDDNATDANPDDDTLRTRANNAFDSYSATARVAQGVGGGRIALTYDRLGKRQGVPGTGANTALHARLLTDRDVAVLRAAASEHAALAPVLSLWYARQRDQFQDLERELTGAKQDNDDHTTRYGARTEASLPLPGRAGGSHRLALLGEARRERYTPKINLPAPRVLPTSQREFVAFGAEDRWSPGRGRFGLTAQARHEVTYDAFPAGPAYPGALPSPAAYRSTPFTRWTLAARYELVRSTSGSLAFKTSAAQLGRMPTLEELFGNRGGVHGNRDARPEQVFTRDAGLIGAWTLGGGGAVPRTLEAQLSAYRSDADDLLVFLQNSAQTSVAQNIAAARLEGLEMSARSLWAMGLGAELAWTRQWTKDLGQVAYWRGKELPGRPRDEVSLGLSLTRGPVRTFGELHATSEFFLDRYNQTTVAARALVDVGTSCAFAGGTSDFVLECRNVGDAHAQDFGGYPLPGRSWALGIRFHLDRKAGLP